MAERTERVSQAEQITEIEEAYRRIVEAVELPTFILQPRVVSSLPLQPRIVRSFTTYGAYEQPI